VFSPTIIYLEDICAVGDNTNSWMRRAGAAIVQEFQPSEYHNKYQKSGIE
jgi:hypothetical protein